MASCSVKRLATHNKVCNCCETVYDKVEIALDCISKEPTPIASSDNRLLLLAFVKKDLPEKQKLGWEILTENRIIEVAKRNYLLIIIDAGQINRSKEIPTELFDVIEEHNEDVFFVITNQALYPFSDWTLTEKKDIIIDRLEVGNGP